MAWCKASSLTVAVSMTLKGARFPLSRARILSIVSDQKVDGWELNFFLEKALHRKSYKDLRGVMTDLETWLEAQG